MTPRKPSPKWPNERPDVPTAEVVARYADGASTLELAKQYGCCSRTIVLRLLKAGVVLRGQGKFKRYPLGHGAHWHGDAATYSAKHRRVYYHRGQPQHCEECGRTDGEVAYDWANLTGNYGDIADYKRMCRPCHRKFDGARAKREAA